MNSSIEQIKVAELSRRIQIFPRVLPNNPENKKWATMDVSRVMLRFATIRTFDPAKEGDKIDMHHALRVQFYSDIKLACRAKAHRIQEENARRRLGNWLSDSMKSC